MSLPILFFYGFAFIGIVHSIIFSFLAIKHKRTADLLITLFLFIQSLIILEYVFYWTGLLEKFHQLSGMSLSIQFLFGPLLLMYVDFVFYENKKNGKYFPHFIPAIIAFILMLPYFLSTADLKFHHYKMIKYFVLDFQYVFYFITVHMTAYFIVILFKINKEKRIGHIKKWLLTITGLFGFYILSCISFFIVARLPWHNLATNIVNISMCTSIVAIIYFAYGKKKILDGFEINESLNLENLYFSQKATAAVKNEEHTLNYYYPSNADKMQVAENVSPEAGVQTEIALEPVLEVTSVKYKNSGLTTDAGIELAEALNRLMQKEKLYRESELKLETLAAKLGVPKHYVSQIVNQHFGVNFFEYINLLRIEEAKQLLVSSDKKNMNIIEVAYTVGYNTKNTFNTAFRRITGLTPTEYRNKNKISLN